MPHTKWERDFERRWSEELSKKKLYQFLKSKPIADIEGTEGTFADGARYANNKKAEHPTPKINEEIKKLIPEIIEKDFNALKESIRKNGLQSPIDVAPDGTILDGHNRLKICEQLKKEPEFRVIAITDPLIQKQYAIESNFARRHLNTFQRAEMWLPLVEIEKQLAEQRQKAGTLAPKEAKGKSTQRAAQKIGLSTTTLEHCLTILREGDDDLIDDLRKGKKNIFSAYKLVRGGVYTHEREEQVEALQQMAGIKEYMRILLNAGVHNRLKDAEVLVSCPKCGAGSAKLGWTCCNLPMEEAAVEANTRFTEVQHIRPEVKTALSALNRGTRLKIESWARRELQSALYPKTGRTNAAFEVSPEAEEQFRIDPNTSIETGS